MEKSVEASLETYKLAIPSLEDLARYSDNAKFDEYLTTVKAFDVPRIVYRKPELKSFNKEKIGRLKKVKNLSFILVVMQVIK